MSRPDSIGPELVEALRRLRLSQIASTLPERLTLAEKQSMPFQELLLLVLADEIARRDSSATERRAREARLDPEMTLERFDKSAKITYDKRLFAELCSLRFLETHKHVVLLGPVGVGKTFLAHALGQTADHVLNRSPFTLMNPPESDGSIDICVSKLATSAL